MIPGQLSPFPAGNLLRAFSSVFSPLMAKMLFAFCDLETFARIALLACISRTDTASFLNDDGLHSQDTQVHGANFTDEIPDGISSEVSLLYRTACQDRTE